MSHTKVKNVIKGLGGDPIWFFVVVGTYTKCVSDEFAIEQGLKFCFFNVYGDYLCSIKADAYEPAGALKAMVADELDFDASLAELLLLPPLTPHLPPLLVRRPLLQRLFFLALGPLVTDRRLLAWNTALNARSTMRARFAYFS